MMIKTYMSWEFRYAAFLGHPVVKFSIYRITNRGVQVIVAKYATRHMAEQNLSSDLSILRPRWAKFSFTLL